MKVGICTGGGDCPGLNSVIRSIVRHGMLNHGFEVVGIKDCFNGLLARPFQTMPFDDPEDVAEILHRGGTILGTTNSGNPFSLKDPKKVGNVDESHLIVEAYKELGLDVLVVVGGDGTQGIAYRLSKLGINIVGVPKTIDNDLAATEQTVGFDTAVDVVAEAVGRLQSTAESHDRIMLLEVMGRHAGHLALHGGLAGGAHAILIPEIPFDVATVAQALKARAAKGKKFSVVVVAEGAFAAGDDPMFKQSSSGSVNLGGIGAKVAEVLYKKTDMETRVTVLGHTQRGGEPSAYDRILGTMYGHQAVEMVKKREFGKIVSFSGGKMKSIDYTEVAGRFRPVDVKNDVFLKAAEGVGICFGR